MRALALLTVWSVALARLGQELSAHPRQLPLIFAARELD